MGTQDLLHAVYVGCMAAGATLFYAWSRNPRGVPRYEYLIAMFIPVWSGLAYLAMAFGYGKVEVDGQVTHYARYADWLVTTPLLLLALALTAMHTVKKDVTLIATLVGLDVVMISCALVADLSEDRGMRWTFYAIGCVALAVIVGIVWGPLRRIADAQHRDVGRLYRKLAVMLAVLWACYPVIWAVGPSGVRLIDQTTETLLFVALPIVSKVGFSIVDLSGLRKLEHLKAHADPTALTAPPSPAAV